jgi:hypothetical protein
MPTKVYYQGKEVLGDPFVSRNETPIDYGNRWGMSESITLNGMLEGLDFHDSTIDKYAWQYLTEDIFKVNFQELKVVEDGVDYLVYPTVMIESIDFPQDKWGRGNCDDCSCSDAAHVTKATCETACSDTQYTTQVTCEAAGTCTNPTYTTKVDCEGMQNGGTWTPETWTTGNTWSCIPTAFDNQTDCADNNGTWNYAGIIKYTVKLKTYDIFSSENIIDPKDSYSFTENNDGTVNVTHDISAKGIKTNTSSAFDNALTFVNKFAGINHFGTCDPYFITNNQPIFLNQTESIDRLNGTYSLTENYKYQHEWVGYTPVGYIRTNKINLSEDVKADFNTVQWESQYKTDASYGMGSLRNVVKSQCAAGGANSIQAEIAGVVGVPQNEIYRTDFSIAEDPKAYTIDYKASFIIGMEDIERFKGYFDYATTMTTDAMTDTTVWTIDGQYITYGTVEQKRKTLLDWRNSIDNPDGLLYKQYLSRLLEEDELFKYYHMHHYGEWPPNSNNDGGGWLHEDHGKANAGQGDLNYEQVWLTSMRVTENVTKGTLSLNATFSDEDRVHSFLVIDPANNARTYISNRLDGEIFDQTGAEPGENNPGYRIGYPIKYNVSVTEAINTYKLLPSANVEGVFALQNLQCRRKGKTKISINGTSIGGAPLDEVDVSENVHGKDISLLYAASEETMRAVENALLESYNNAWRTEEGQDVTIPSSISRNREYTYDPNETTGRNWQREIYNNIRFQFVDHKRNYTRARGAKFGF